MSMKMTSESVNIKHNPRHLKYAYENPNLYYNYNFKKEFASLYNDNTSVSIMAMFRKTCTIECELNKDIYEFKVEDFYMLLKSLRAKTLRSLQNYISTLNKYIEFSLNHNKKTKLKNISAKLNNKEKIKKFIDTEIEMIFSREEIEDMAQDTANPQDGAILMLLFEGVSKNENFKELIELKKDDINFKNKTITLSNRKIKVGDITLSLIENSLNENIYYSIKGDSVRRYEIADGDNILRGSRGKSAMRPQQIRERLLRLAEFYGYESLNATNISYSGQIDFAQKIINELNITNVRDVVKKVMNRFNISKNNSAYFYLKDKIEEYTNISKANRLNI